MPNFLIAELREFIFPRTAVIRTDGNMSENVVFVDFTAMEFHD